MACRSARSRQCCGTSYESLAPMASPAAARTRRGHTGAGPAAARARGRRRSPGTGAEARTRLFEELLTLPERLAGAAPPGNVIEDAHWADRSSRELRAFPTGDQRAPSNTLI